jgi:regulator of RNase E activity RraA
MQRQVGRRARAVVIGGKTEPRDFSRIAEATVGDRIQMIQDVYPLGPDQQVLVGEAFTLRYMPAREDLNKIDVYCDRAHPQRVASSPTKY